MKPSEFKKRLPLEAHAVGHEHGMAVAKLAKAAAFAAQVAGVSEGDLTTVMVANLLGLAASLMRKDGRVMFLLACEEVFDEVDEFTREQEKARH